MAGSARITLCASPIGNLGDASIRLSHTLGSADLILAEDTRRSQILLQSLSVKRRAQPYYDHNQQPRTQLIRQALDAGQHLAFLADAGTPLVSDPGFELVQIGRELGAEISVIPGPSAVTAAWAVAGIGGHRFLFEGFLPTKTSLRQQALDRTSQTEVPLILFVSPHRFVTDLTDLIRHLGPDRQICVVRELTKLHEQIWWGSLTEAQAYWSEQTPRGELTLVVEASPSSDTPAVSDAAQQAVVELIESGASPTAAVKVVSRLTECDRRQLYQAFINHKPEQT